MKNIEDSLKQKLYECNRHIEKLNDAKEYLQNTIPLSVEEYLKIDEIAHEYSFNQNEIVDSINLIYTKTDELISIYKKLSDFIKTIDD